ncbi:glycosyltransferase [Patescibacteria group bacterium]|nr:glycosyltransferase [Patescibacteria group bacterium]
MKISVVTPCYNEAVSIAKVIEKITKEVDEIIVVGNDSTDQTALIAQNLGAKVVSEQKQDHNTALKEEMRLLKISSSPIGIY